MPAGTSRGHSSSTNLISEIEGFRRAIETLRQAFPALRIHADDASQHPAVDASAVIGPQSGLDFGVTFLLQDRDEIQLTVGTTSFRVSWFPCSDPVVVTRFTEAVAGLLSGHYRIIEQFIGDEAVKAELQRPRPPSEWETIATWRSLLSLIPWRRRRVITQNLSGRVSGPDAAGA